MRLLILWTDSGGGTLRDSSVVTQEALAPRAEGRLVNRLLACALVCSIALVLAATAVVNAPQKKRALAVARPAVLHFPLIHTLNRERPAPAGHIVTPAGPANPDTRPARVRTRKLPLWFVRRRMAIVSVQLT